MISNSYRAGRALQALREYARLADADGEPLEALLGDLLTDARHLAEREGIDVEGAVSLSALHFDAEQNNRPRSILNPNGRLRVILEECPVCEKDHTSWTGCWLAEIGRTLQDRGWSTAEIATAIGKIPDFQAIQDIYDAHIGPAVDAVEAYLPTQEQLEQKEAEDFEKYGPNEAQLNAYHGRRP